MIERKDTAGAIASAFGVKPRVRLTEIQHFSRSQEVEQANAAHDLVALIGRSIRLVRDGDKWRGICPFHGDKRLSTFLVDPKSNRYFCTLCGAEGDALSWIMQEQGLNFHQVVALSLKRPITTAFRQKDAIRNAIACATIPPSDEGVRRHKLDLAKKVCDESVSATRTLVERFLFAHGLVFDGDLPDCLRFHPNLCHEPSRQFFPAMIAIAHKPDGTFSGIHRTYLSPDGLETANVVQGGVRRMLGECFGAHVHIHTGLSDSIAIAESVEDALAISQSCPDITVWASMALGNLKAPILSSTPEIVLCAAGNNSDPHMAERILLEAAHEHSARKHKVLIARAPRGMNFNDVLLV